MKITLWRCTAGAVGVVTAIVVPILLGFGSLGVEVGHWYLMQRQMQGAADAAAISAGSEYVKQYNLGNQSSATYKTVGQSYAALNGFNISTSNVCLIDPRDVDGCGFIEALDPRGQVICTAPPCIAVEITQDTMQWLTTKASLEPNGFGSIKPIPTPTLYARSVVSVKSQLTTTDTGVDCILALANDPSAILVHGNADLKAQCGVAVDGGIDQNSGTPVRGGISFDGGGVVNITHLYVAAPSTNCPDNGTHCQQFASNAALPASAVSTNTATPDPYAAQIASLFGNPPPAGVSDVAINTAGSGYTNGTCTFTVTGGTAYGAGSTPAIFTATVSKGKVSKIGSILDPGAYATRLVPCRRPPTVMPPKVAPKRPSH